jgi:hypothetical protein
MYFGKALVLLMGLALLSCSTVGIYHVSERPLPEGDGIYLIKPPGYTDVNFKMPQGRFPDVNADAGCILFTKPSSETPGGPMTEQVFWAPLSYPNISNIWSVKLTHTSGNKRHPRWGERWYAYQLETANGDKIVISSHNNLTAFELSPTVRGGIDFFDNGNKIVYTAEDGLYWIEATPDASPVLIVECPAQSSRCSFPVISHSGALLAYRHTVPLAAGWIESIRIIRVGTWDFVRTIMMDASVDLRSVNSFDFSPDDSKLYVTAKSNDVVSGDSNNKLEIYSVDIVSGFQRRITNNEIPDYYPSTLDLKEYTYQCDSFETLKVGDRFNVGETASASELDISVGQFQWGDGIWTSSGHAEIDGNNYTNGSGRSIRANNVNLEFQHIYPVTEIRLQFAELGGNNNITVNDVFSNVGDIVDLDGTYLGGVELTVDASQSGYNWIGQLTLRGNISSFSIGGQELWIDDYCFISR